MAPTLISDEMRSILGVTTETAESYPVSASDIRRWAFAVYWPDTPPRIYWDEDHAATTTFGGIVAPAEFNPFAWGARRREVPATPTDGADTSGPGKPEMRLGVEAPDLDHLLNGGLEHVYEDVPIRPGDVITSTSAIVDYKERAGRLGHMLFTTLQTRYTNQRDELVSTQRITLIRY